MSAKSLQICLTGCVGLTLGGSQVPSKAALPLPSSAEQGRENRMKSLWVGKGTGRDHSPVPVMGKTDSTWGYQVWLGQWKVNPNLRTPFLHPSFLPGISFTPYFLCLLSLQQFRGQWMGSVASSSHIVSPAPFSSGSDHSNPSSACGSSTRRQSFPNFSNMTPSLQAAVLHGLL